MSRFSGKCDLYDWFFMNRDCDLDFIKRSKIYIGFSLKRVSGTENFEVIFGDQLCVESMKDLVPYYPYLVSMGTRNEEGDTIYLCKKPYPDMLWEELGHKPIMYDYYKEELEKEIQKYEDE